MNKVTKMTVNELMSFMKMLRERLSSLRDLRHKSSVRVIRFVQDDQTVEEPLYDVAEVDKKIVEIENFLFLADGKIKMINAKTVVDMDIDVDNLLAPVPVKEKV